MIILNPIMTEKATGAIERENKITFSVDTKATKPEVKKEVERLFGEKVASVNVVIDPKGVKKAMVKFVKPGAAADVASKLKLI
jgi:large subunit ribosomal protein L23